MGHEARGDTRVHFQIDSGVPQKGNAPCPKAGNGPRRAGRRPKETIDEVERGGVVLRPVGVEEHPQRNVAVLDYTLSNGGNY